MEVYSAAPFVELFLNGKSLGKQATENAMAVFACTYEPGALEAVSFDSDGNETGRSKLESAQGELSIRLTQEEVEVKAGSLVFVDVDLVGENGVVESNADTALTVTVEGGTLIGFGSARARTPEKFVEGTYRTYYGRALAAVLIGETGTAVIKVTGNGMNTVFTLK